ncbi:MAG: NAD(P)H-hydrate dehydratase [Oscillibacter sp.]
MKLATAEQMRRMDRKAIEERGISSLDLMDRAAEGVAEAALGLLGKRYGKCRAAVFCGSGNNGGDGIAAARLLFLKGVQVRAFLLGEYQRMTPDALAETGRLSECGVELEAFDGDSEEQKRWTMGADVCVDALFGVGLSREIPPDSPFATAIGWMNETAAAVVAADLPSGVEADTGRVLGLGVKADKTITFTLPKPGHFVGDGGLLSGQVTVWDIGIPPDLAGALPCAAQTVDRDFAAWALPKRREDGHKGNFGKILVVGGSVGYTGAPYLTASAALRCGSGLVYLGVPEAIWAVEAVKCGSAMPFPLPGKDGMLSENALQKIEERLESCDVLALGPGLGRSEETTQLVCALLRRTEKPVVLDADGINALETHIDVLDARRGRVTILTPHDGEFARLSGGLPGGDRLGTARKFAGDHGCVLVLKGHRSLIATPEGNVLVNTTGNSALAKGGSGDVLTGLIASLLGQGATAAAAAGCGVWLHGRCGEVAAERLTEYGVGPEDVIAALPEVLKSIL